jgi:hypothetical protein
VSVRGRRCPNRHPKALISESTNGLRSQNLNFATLAFPSVRQARRGIMKAKKGKRRSRPIVVSFKVRGDEARQWVLDKLMDKLSAMDGVKDLKVGMAAPASMR